MLDVARNLLVVDVEAGAERSRRHESLAKTGIPARIERLKAMSVNVLICGAVSWPLEQALASSGVKVIPHVCGNVEKVLRAYLTNRLQDRTFMMPGCGGCWRRGRRGRGGRRGFGMRGGGNFARI